MAGCVVCGGVLKGRQTRFCSRKCQSRECNNVHQNYQAQKNRAIVRKLALVKKMGGKCSVCGYDTNLASLCFHHKDPSQKSFVLDARSISNRGKNAIETEAEKCELMCHNCHSEHHNPDLKIDDLDSSLVLKSDDPYESRKKDNPCSICGRQMYRSSGKYCIDCYRANQSKLRRPIRTEWPSQS